VSNKLKVWIDNNYRTKRDRNNTAIVGSSHGGLAAFLIAALFPSHFGVSGCFSPSFWVGQWFYPLANTYLIEIIRDSLKEIRPKMWLSYGLIRSGGVHNSIIEYLSTGSTIEMIAILKSEFNYNDDELIVLEDEEGKHEEISWQYQFPRFYTHFFLNNEIS